jgi:uncharacterized protein YndB with AHSA1/START domain
VNEPTPADGIVERTPDGGVIRFERRLPYPVREVWHAITDPTQLAQWWLPVEAEVSVDLREGGQMVFDHRGDEPFTLVCEIRRVEAPMLLEHTHPEEGSFIRWELEPVATGCVLRLTHVLPDPDAGIGKCFVVGLHTSLDRLGPCLAGHPVPWDWDRFAATQEQYAQLGLAPRVDPDDDTG